MTVLYYTVLYYTILYCTILYCTILYCTVLYYTALYCTVLCRTILYSTVQYSIETHNQSAPTVIVNSYHMLYYVWYSTQNAVYKFTSAQVWNRYRWTGFKCEHVIIANCDFSPSAQLLERNVYITHSINQYVARA